MDRVQGWLSRVKAVENKADDLMRHSSQEIENHSRGIEAATMLRVVETLMGEGSFELVAERVPEDAAEEINCESTIIGMVSTFEKAWRCLEEE
ncbi:hypothetical protein CUMW_259380 [Citrus unshiu]|uniref:Uncharacterized protein n=1 Tax=Citrus unshiu TaxID=55188 RepID=A0A2H5QT71_CITUN|nr:hypothetical protein CUMW_259380 [Citrus unshiu]